MNRKYNLSKIMKAAWKSFNAPKYDKFAYKRTFSECLKAAWASAKREAAQNEQMGQQFRNGMVIKCGFFEYICNLWEKNGMKRVYLNKIQPKTNKVRKMYVDLITGEAYGVEADLEKLVKSLVF